MFGLILTLLSLGNIASPVVIALPPAATQSCPADSPIARRRLNNLLIAPNHAAFRTRVGISSIDTSHVRVLSDSLDATMCDQLNSNLSGQGSNNPFTYYAAGGMFFVVQGTDQTTTQPDGHTLHNEWARILVLDSSLTVLGVEGI